VSIGAEALAMVHIGLHRFEPRFHVRVVVHAPRPIHAWYELRPPQVSLGFASEILDASIRMEDRAGLAADVDGVRDSVPDARAAPFSQRSVPSRVAFH
jgi:hypothetical protein